MAKDNLASGARSATFALQIPGMTAEKWAAMFEPDKKPVENKQK